MPYPNFHACRIEDPGKFSKIRYKSQDGADVLMGQVKGSSEWKVQAIRYPKDKWGAEKAAASCKGHGGTFEAASGMAAHSDEFDVPAEMIPGLVPWGPDDGELPEEAIRIFEEVTQHYKTYAQEMKGVEIFSAGVWNGDPYTEDDLDMIVENYPKMPRRPPLKLGHTEAQKFFGQADGHPALGWVGKVYRSGRKLLADLTNVPDALVGMIKSKAYDRVSAEIYWNYKLADGKVLPRALKAVSILGADWPAVSNLQDLQAALMGEADRIVKAYGQEEAEVRIYEKKDDQGGDDMDEKQYKDQIADLTGKLETATTDGKAAITRAEAAEKVALEAELKVFSLELDGLVRQGKILPAEVDGYKADFMAMGTSTRKYTEGGKEVEKSWGQKKLEELKARPKLVEFKEKAQGGDDEPAKKAPAGESVHQLTEKIMAERKCTYSEAQEAVRTERPDLFKAYVNRKEEKK